MNIKIEALNILSTVNEKVDFHSKNSGNKQFQLFY